MQLSPEYTPSVNIGMVRLKRGGLWHEHGPETEGSAVWVWAQIEPRLGLEWAETGLGKTQS